MNTQTFEIYEQIQTEVSKFAKLKLFAKTQDAKIGAEGIMRGLEIALEIIIRSDK